MARYCIGNQIQSISIITEGSRASTAYRKSTIKSECLSVLFTDASQQSRILLSRSSKTIFVFIARLSLFPYVVIPFGIAPRHKLQECLQTPKELSLTGLRMSNENTNSSELSSLGFTKQVLPEESTNYFINYSMLVRMKRYKILVIKKNSGILFNEIKK